VNKTTSPLPSVPSEKMIAKMLTEWVDPITEEPPGTRYSLYPTPSRGADAQGSYLIYLPPGYERDITKHFPVIYWLHGGFGNARQGAWEVQYYDAAIRAQVMPEVIFVLVQALPIGWYVDSKDGKLPVEQVIIKDLIPHIDVTYRTIAQKDGRGIEGHSMGGYGALHLGLKFPYIFGAVSAVAPSILRNLTDEPLYRTSYTFENDQDYYEQVGPWNLAQLNAENLRGAKTNLRILSGADDLHLQLTLRDYDKWLKRLDIEHAFFEIEGAGHDYQDILEKYGEENFYFWERSFENIR